MLKESGSRRSRRHPSFPGQDATNWTYIHRLGW